MVLFPVLRRVDEVLAIGYLVVRGAVETACYVISALSWLLLLPLGEAMSKGPGTASPANVRLGNLLVDSVDVSAVTAIVFCLGGVMFYLLLYRSRIAPAGSRCGVLRLEHGPTCERHIYRREFLWIPDPGCLHAEGAALSTIRRAAHVRCGVCLHCRQFPPVHLTGGSR